MRDGLNRFARAVGAYMPDATALAVGMLALLFALALGLGNTFVETTDAFYRGLWMLLAFSMQMALVLLLSTVLSAAPGFRKVVFRLAAVPRSAFQVVAVASFLAAALSYLYWGLGIALGPLIAIHFARAAEARGIRVDFPWLLATILASTAIWQFGLSSTPALLVATPGHFLEAKTGLMPLATTIWSDPALLVVALFPVALVVTAWLVRPREPEPLSAFPNASALTRASETVVAATEEASGLARWSERSRLVPLTLVLLLGAWLWHHFVTRGAGLDLNSMITILLAAALLLQRDLASFSAALKHAVGSVWPILVLYQVYGGVAGLLQYTTVGTALAGAFASVTTELTFPLMTALAGTVVSFFVPSSGGQWVIQGFLTTETAAAVGATPQQGLLALGVGDHMGNLLSPFWVIVAASIARIDFRRIYGYGLIYAALWFVVGVAIFTLVPAVTASS